MPGKFTFVSLYCSLDARDSISVQLASGCGLADSEFESIMEDHQEPVKWRIIFCG